MRPTHGEAGEPIHGPGTGAQDVSATPRLSKRRERRFWERFPARGPSATLTWLEGTTERTIQGDLVNIGGEGVSFVSDVVPPPDVPIWLQLEASGRQDGQIDPVECRLVETADDPSGIKVAHIRFVDQCTIDLFDLTVTRVN